MSEESKKNQKPFGQDRLVYSATDTMELLSIGKTTLYKLLNRGALKSTKICSKTVFLATDIAAFLEQLQQGETR